MRELRENGRYELSEEAVKTMKKDFAAYYLDEHEIAKEIKNLYDKHSYLIDSHTAIASGALNLFREENGDDSAAVILSTASPYKFAEFALSSISEDTEDILDPIKSLHELSGIDIPEYIKAIEKRPIRFKEVVKREEMKDKVLLFGSVD